MGNAHGELIVRAKETADSFILIKLKKTLPSAYPQEYLCNGVPGDILEA
jgi:hypothetical protein